MRTKALDTVNRYLMLEQGDRVCVALSGGADSVALLAFLRSLAEERCLEISACHLNHNLRGSESQRDEQFVRELCDRWGIPLAVRSRNIGEIARERSLSEETAGREERYAMFADIHRENGCKIATAHTLSDSVETVIFQMARGSGLKGLRGIVPTRGYIIRPLINCTREDIERYCAEQSLEFVQDSTNFLPNYTRNRIRLEIVPRLREINPAVLLSIGRLSQTASDCYNLVLSLAQDFISQHRSVQGKFNCEALMAQNSVVRREVLSILCERAGIKLSARHTELCISMLESGGAVELGNGVLFSSAGGWFEIGLRSDGNGEWLDEVLAATAEELRGDFSREYRLYDDKILKMYTLDCEQSKNFNEQKKLLLKNTLACGKIRGNLVLRGRKTGDSITLAHRGVSKSLKKLFNEAGIAPELRGRIAVLADDEGVLWVEGFGVHARGAVVTSEKNPQKIIIIEVKEVVDDAECDG